MNENDSTAARTARIAEAIDKGPKRMSQIADEMGVARTSVLNWRRKGTISLENLRALAEITGYRFWWLAFGEGPKTYEHDATFTDEEAVARKTLTHESSASIARLHECIQHMQSAGILNDDIADAVTNLITTIFASQSDPSKPNKT